jgi:hypothetical protein
MHEPQNVGILLRLTYFEGLALGLAVLLVFGGVAWLMRYLEHKGVNALISLAVFGLIVAFLVFHIRWPR